MLSWQRNSCIFLRTYCAIFLNKSPVTCALVASQAQLFNRPDTVSYWLRNYAAQNSESSVHRITSLGDHVITGRSFNFVYFVFLSFILFLHSVCVSFPSHPLLSFSPHTIAICHRHYTNSGSHSNAFKRPCVLRTVRQCIIIFCAH